MNARCLLLFLLLSAAVFAQTADSPQPVEEPSGVLANTPVPTVSFTFDWPELRPQHYTIRVESAGRATFFAIDDKTKPGEPYRVRFTASEPTRDRIFQLAKALNYFNGKFDYTKNRIAFTGAKTLTYTDPVRVSKTTFNWSENQDLMELAAFFIGIANTFNGGRRLEYLLRYDRLGLNSQLRAMEDAAKGNGLNEVEAIASLLQRIADDPSVMDIARQRARRLLQLIPTKPAASSTSP